MCSEIYITFRNYKYVFNQIKFLMCEDGLSFLCIKFQIYGFSLRFASAVCVIVISWYCLCVSLLYRGIVCVCHCYIVLSKLHRTVLSTDILIPVMHRTASKCGTRYTF
jgi:hypothetical protein